MVFFVTVCYADESLYKGSKLYQKQKFNEAAETFQQVQNQNPDDPVVNYNLASSYYKQDLALLTGYANIMS